MDFSSIPAYLDPANWQQHPNYQITGSGGSDPHLPQPPQSSLPPPPPQPHVGGGGGGTGSIRPGSMADRARMANLPMPETALKCPRCESTNTKFCYFNNYSLTQPRHFCKTCRRYWTRGGALRSVPVGGGCRRNKRTKGSNSKSPASSGDHQSTPSSSMGTTAVPSSSGNTPNILGLTSQFPQLRFMASLGQHNPDYGPNEIGLNYGGIPAPVAATSEMNFQIGSNLFGGGGGGGGGIEQWRLQQPQQFPFFGGLEPPPLGVYQFQGGGEPSGYGGGRKITNPMLNSETASVKMEENIRDQSNFSRPFLGVNIPGNDQWSSGNTAWTDLSGFSSSSTSNNPL